MLVGGAAVLIERNVLVRPSPQISHQGRREKFFTITLIWSESARLSPIGKMLAAKARKGRHVPWSTRVWGNRGEGHKKGNDERD
jgi:hypothetical protein